MINKIYNLTGRNCQNAVTVISSNSNGSELLIWSDEIFNAQIGDSLLLDRPHFRNSLFKIKEIRNLPNNPDVFIARISHVSDCIGGYKGKLRLKYKQCIVK